MIYLKFYKRSNFQLSFFQNDSYPWQDFTLGNKNEQLFKNLYGFGGRRLKISYRAVETYLLACVTWLLFD